jgi:hypothetical protein
MSIKTRLDKITAKIGNPDQVKIYHVELGRSWQEIITREEYIRRGGKIDPEQPITVSMARRYDVKIIDDIASDNPA